MSNDINTVAFTQDNQSAFISDHDGSIKMIKWKQNANHEYDFKITQNSIQIGNKRTFQICLTKDDKNLLVGSEKLVSVYNIEKMNVTKEFKLNIDVVGIKLINYDKNALIAEKNGDLTIINLETLKMSTSHKNTANGKQLLEIAVI